MTNIRKTAAVAVKCILAINHYALQWMVKIFYKEISRNCNATWRVGSQVPQHMFLGKEVDC